jgi:hypothetical protein
MGTFKNRLQTLWIFAEKQKKTVQEMSGFVYPRKKRIFLFYRILYRDGFCEADKTGQLLFCLSKIGILLSKIVYISMCYMSNGSITFAVDKIQK